MKKVILTLITLLFILTGCKSPEVRPPVTVKSRTFWKKSAERNKKLKAFEESKIMIMINNDSLRNYLSSENGFWYTYNNELKKDTLQPQFGDIVNFDFDINALNGKEIYSKDFLGNQNYKIDQQELFLGLREGLKIMKPTESITFIFPSQIAYGYYGDENKIGANTPIICNVTLNSITKND